MNQAATLLIIVEENGKEVKLPIASTYEYQGDTWYLVPMEKGKMERVKAHEAKLTWSVFAVPGIH